MRRFVTQNKILTVFVSLLLFQILLVAESSSDKDDVAAMITNAKKVPHTVFIIDTSETMNSFAYSDYIETCEDAIHNADHAYDICMVSLRQCNEVKADAGCVGGSIDCTTIQNNCTQLNTAKGKIRSYCADVEAVFKFPNYPNENRQQTASASSTLSERFVGPWNPSSLYDDDICFYDWTSDTNGDVLSGNTSDNWSNLSKDDSKSTTVDGVTYYGTDRRDWDCITDGNGKMDNGRTFTSVSGFWLNWKYATSLDAVKILLADTHQFSYPPRSRGKNRCAQYYYKPVSEEDDTTSCDPSSGETTCKKKVCYISPDTGTSANFDTAYLDKSEDEREKILEALKQIVAENWTASEPTVFDDASMCAQYTTIDDFSMYDDRSSYGSYPSNFEKGKSNHPAPVNAVSIGTSAGVGCEKCMAFNGDTTNPAFVETGCTEFVPQDDSAISRQGMLGSYKIKFHQECCKTSKCTNPKCRDNDLCCKKDNSDVYTDPTSEGYQQCVAHGMTCELGFYSEFDQDMTHCCDSLECVSGETSDQYDVYEGCQICKEGSAITEDTVLLSDFPASGTTVLPGSYTYNPEIELLVKISAMTGYDDIEDMTINLYYECNGLSTDAWNLLATSTCYYESSDPEQLCSHYLPSDPDTQGVIMKAHLSGCETSGYKVRASVSATGRYCSMGDTQFYVELKYKLPDEPFSGVEQSYKVLDPDQNYYMIIKNEAAGGAKNPIVQEYECKNAFYHTQAFTSGSRCPTSAYQIVNEFHSQGYPDVQYCDPDSRRQETIITSSGCGFETSYFCSYLCRDEITYDEPWKCMAWFYQMDEMDRGGLEECSHVCQKASGMNDGHNYTEECCRCVDTYYYNAGWANDYHYFEPVDGVTMPATPGSSTKKTFHCAVSGIMGSDTQVGWHAEIINGHIKETPTGSYLLTPYLVDNGEGEDVLFSPYEANHWIQKKTYLYQKQHTPDLKDTSISVFKTASTADSRENVCIYDVVEAWGGDMCNTCSTCSFGCVDDPSIKVADDKCAYPSFWMKVPQSEGGELVLRKEELKDLQSTERFQDAIKKLKAVGGPTLGETLYDAWRFLGGMYAVYDPNHRYYNYNPTADKWVAPLSSETVNPPYESPFENLDASCFLSEIVLVSGGQAQFDHNDKITKFDSNGPSGMNCSDNKIPCVEHTPDKPSEHKPYYLKDWSQTSVEKVAEFVKTHPFYHPDALKTAGCVKTTDFSHNLLGYDDSCKGDASDPTNKYYRINKEGSSDRTVVNRIHTAAIGEWTLSTFYNTTELKYLENITKKAPSEVASEDGKYCSLTLGSNSEANCSFNNITQVFNDLLKDPQKTDVVAGRPHWTSSLVQPYDVEEKYRGPEAYIAGTVPIEPSKSRFWFGNLKKYMIDEGDGSCGSTVTGDDSDPGCGGWKKQTISVNDCFKSSDAGEDITDAGDDTDAETETTVTEFRRLLAGGAARKLSDKLIKKKCSGLPCYKNVDLRNIYYDDGSSLISLKDITPDDLSDLAFDMGLHNDITQAQQILDYMYGYDSFAGNASGEDIDAKRKALRFGYSSINPDGDLIEVLDPMNIDFNKDKKIKIRPLLLGAIIHSKPVAVYYGIGNQKVTRIFAGANDGMLHAFDGSGEEKWAYIPSKALPAIAAIGKNNSSEQIVFNPSVDGPITLFHIDTSHDGIINGGEKAYLVFGYRRGAKAYTVIDVSEIGEDSDHPDKPKFVQNITTGGYSFGKAVIFRKCNMPTCSYANQLDYYLAVPGGYDDCADGYVPTCAMPENSMDPGATMHGNNFAIYHFNKSSGKFNTTPVLEYKRNPSGESDVHKKWLVAPFASEPFAINTEGKGAVNTEFVYFTDLTGTVFRVHVSKTDTSEWKTKVVFANRSAAGDKGGVDVWAQGKTYVGNNFFPPLEKYNPGNDSRRIPIPVVSGNASLPKVNDENASMTVFYDVKPRTAEDETKAYSGYNSSKYETSSLNNHNKFHGGDIEDEEQVNIHDINNLKKSGWRIDFNSTGNAPGEKGITEPLVVYDFYGSKQNAESGKNGYSLAWNTFVPKDITECKNFGTSFNYERLLIDGSQALSITDMTENNAIGEWNPANCKPADYTSAQGISIATGVGVVATDNGYDLAFGAGADIFRKTEMAVLFSTTRIIKWYELY